MRQRLEELSGFWYAVFTIDIILGAILVWWTLNTPETQEIRPEVEHFERQEVKVEPIGSGEHTEEITCGVVVSDKAVYMLSHLMGGEAGADWCTDELQLMVGSVVLNRVASDKFPNDLESVIFQDGQYSVTWNGAYEKEPTQRTVDNARYLLEHGPTIPGDVLFQANFPQKTTYKVVQGVYFGH